jgi:hypothetical protein
MTVILLILSSVLIGADDKLKVSDFGTSRRWKDSAKMSFCGM